MSKQKKNIVLIDSDETEGEEFIKGLEDSTGLKWELIVETSNDRRTKLKELIRYFKYLWVPFKIFVFRNRYNNIVAWQQFYGTLFAFYCRLFRVKKANNLIVMSFIYKPKSGFIDKMYFRFMRFAVTSKYIDAFTNLVAEQCENFSILFNVEKSKFRHLSWGISDLYPKYSYLKRNNELPYFFCAGRSNRDWNIVFSSLGDTDIPCKFIYSEESYKSKFKNIELFSNVPDEEYFRLSLNSYCVIISIQDCSIAGGEITIINAMQFAKPVILVQDKPDNDYVFDGITGFIVKKDAAAIYNAAKKLYADKELREQMSKNARAYYENRFAIYPVGKNIGEIINNTL